MIIEDVIDAVCATLELEPATLVIKPGGHKHNIARKMVVLMCRRILRPIPSWGLIGDYLDRSGSTCQGAYESAEKFLEKDTQFRLNYMAAVRQLNEMPEGRQSNRPQRNGRVFRRRDNAKTRRDEYVKPKAQHEAKPRSCLRCQKIFQSEHVGNRICRNCKGLEEVKAFSGLKITYAA